MQIQSYDDIVDLISNKDSVDLYFVRKTDTVSYEGKITLEKDFRNNLSKENILLEEEDRNNRFIFGLYTMNFDSENKSSKEFNCKDLGITVESKSKTFTSKEEAEKYSYEINSKS